MDRTERSYHYSILLAVNYENHFITIPVVGGGGVGFVGVATK